MTLTPDRVSAVIVTRGNVNLNPILETLPYDDVVVWDNSRRQDWKIYGRYVAIEEAKHDVIYFQDDDVIFTAHDALLSAYEPGRIVANMDARWVANCGYHDLVMVGAGSLCDRQIPAETFRRYFDMFPLDDEFLLECDFVLGVLAPWRRVDVGYRVREFVSAPDRLCMQPWQAATKQKFIDRARMIRDAPGKEGTVAAKKTAPKKTAAKKKPAARKKVVDVAADTKQAKVETVPVSDGYEDTTPAAAHGAHPSGITDPGTTLGGRGHDPKITDPGTTLDR